MLSYNVQSILKAKNYLKSKNKWTSPLDDMLLKRILKDVFKRNRDKNRVHVFGKILDE